MLFGVREVREGRKDDLEIWGKLTRVLGCKIFGKFEILKSLEEKFNCFFGVLLVMSVWWGVVCVWGGWGYFYWVCLRWGCKVWGFRVFWVYFV